MVINEEEFQEVRKAVEGKKTLILVGNCYAEYYGRATSKIAEGDRIVIIKRDGSFLVHQNKKLAAINYQPPNSRVSCELLDGCLLLQARNPKKKEMLKVLFNKLYYAGSFELKDDENITVFATEEDLARDLMQDLSVIEEGLVPLKNEAMVLKGFIDILAEDKQGRLVVIEVKRRVATLDAVSQLKRYVAEVMKEKNKPVRGILCAPSISPNAHAYLLREGFEYRKIEYDPLNKEKWIKGVSKKQKPLAEFMS